MEETFYYEGPLPAMQDWYSEPSRVSARVLRVVVVPGSSRGGGGPGRGEAGSGGGSNASKRYAHSYAHTHAHAHAYAHTHAHAHTHTHMHTRTHAHTHTRMRAHIHTINCLPTMLPAPPTTTACMRTPTLLRPQYAPRLSHHHTHP